MVIDILEIALLMPRHGNDLNTVEVQSIIQAVVIVEFCEFHALSQIQENVFKS